jgi:tRNA threonylcarbamoyladenosine biosynthesis protein TsaB
MEVYTQLFNADGVAQGDVEAKIIDEESFVEERNGKPFVIFGSGAKKCEEVLQGATFIEVVPSARGMARLAEKAFAEGKTEDVAYFEPFYLKDFVVGTAKKSLLERVMK